MMLADIALQFFALFSERQFDAAGELMHPDVNVWLPNTREVFRGREKYLCFNQQYPGHWRFTIEKVFSVEDTVVVAALVEAQGEPQTFHIVTFMTFKDQRILEMDEYWGDNGEPPLWRLEAGLSERY